MGLALMGGVPVPFALAEPSGETAFPPYRPPFERMHPIAAWEMDITDAFQSEQTGHSLNEFSSETGTRPRVRGQTHKWVAEVHLPEDAVGPFVLEADEARCVERVTIAGKKLEPMTGEGLGSLWDGGEGWTWVGALVPGGPIQIEIEAQDLPHIYPNGFGRLRLRSAHFDENFVLKESGSGVQLQARTEIPDGTYLQYRQEDYFGVPLKEGQIPVAADSKAVIPRPELKHGAYKTRWKIWSGGRSSLEYWDRHASPRLTSQRPMVEVLREGWEFTSPSGQGASGKPPSSGWAPVTEMPFLPPDPAATEMWVRNAFKIPSNWPRGADLNILLPTNIHYEADVWLDGKKIGAVQNWILPASCTIARAVVPGATHELALHIRDFQIGLNEGVTRSGQGPFQPTARTVVAPMRTTGPLRLAFDSAPEVFATPAVRVEHANIRTVVSPTPTISCIAEVRASPGFSGSLQAQIFEAGEARLDLGSQKLSGNSTGTQEVAFEAPFPEAPLWSPADPRLLEMRLTLRDSSGRTVDVFRERFGFREFAVIDGRFVLNGKPIQLLGGSHVDPAQYRWPVRGHPYNFIRHTHTGSGVFRHGTSQAVGGADAADEGGYLLKSADGNMNAHHQDNYDWGNAQLWQRIESSWQATVRAFQNRPSIVMWDVGNELVFPKPGEAERLGSLFDKIREMDPARLVSAGGAKPQPAGAEVPSFHAWGHWDNRTDFFFGRPELRPEYLKDVGTFIGPPDGESDNWGPPVAQIGSPGDLQPGSRRPKEHLGNRAALFAEGHYYESRLPLALLGHDAFLPLTRSQGWAWTNLHGLPCLATRSRSIANVRQGRIPGSMIHVNRGIGRNVFPLVVLPQDRQTRFRAGEKINLSFEVFNNWPEPRTVSVAFALFDGGTQIAEKSEEVSLDVGETKEIAISFPEIETSEDKHLRLSVRARPLGDAGGEFREDLAIKVFAPTPWQLPSGRSLAVFDPHGKVINHLSKSGLEFKVVDDLGAWQPSPGETLLIGPEALAALPVADLGSLANKVRAGGQLIILEHAAPPTFLATPLNPASDRLATAARLDSISPITHGIETTDLRDWQNQHGDQLVSIAPLVMPTSGNALPHITTVNAAPVLELAEGNGRVLFVQLALSAALGLDPAADRILGNILSWTGAEFPDRAVVFFGESPAFRGILEGRMGILGPVSISDSLDQVEVILVDGSDESALSHLKESAVPVRQRIEAGARMFVLQAGPSAAEAIAAVVGEAPNFRPQAMEAARLIEPEHPLMNGLGHGDFVSGDLRNGFHEGALKDNDDRLASFVIQGTDWAPLTKPACLAVKTLGSGEVILDTVPRLGSPARTRALALILSNAGVRLDPARVATTREIWSFQPVDFPPQILESLDDPALADLSPGPQKSGAVPWQATPSTETARPGKLASDGQPVIPVNRPAERLHFVHASGEAGSNFIYRVTYAEDRARWIPGQPDPFVDVQVREGERTLPSAKVPDVLKGEHFLGGAKPAWTGKNGGVLELVWDNPHPEKTIESIEVLPAADRPPLSPPLILAVTLATSGDETAKPDLASVLGPNFKKDQVFAHEHFGDYGFVLLRDGTIGAIYTSSGQRFASAPGWRLRSETDGRPPRILASPAQIPCEISRSRVPGGLRFEMAWTDNTIASRAILLASPSGLRYELEYTLSSAPLPEGDGTRLRLESSLQLHDASTHGVQANKMPIPVTMAEGAGGIEIDPRYITWVFSYNVGNHQVTLLSPPQSAPPLVPGSKESLWWEISPPLQDKNQP